VLPRQVSIVFQRTFDFRKCVFMGGPRTHLRRREFAAGQGGND
jgi:hypothetical protein